MKSTSVKLLLPIFLLLKLSFYDLYAQVYPDHFGTGNDVGVTISSSSEQGSNSAAHTLSGTGHFTDLNGASRFLGQAALGATYDEIDYVTQVGIDAWLDEQFAMSPNSYLSAYQTIYNEVNTLVQTVHPNEVADHSRDYTGFAFYNNCLLYTSPSPRD